MCCSEAAGDVAGAVASVPLVPVVGGAVCGAEEVGEHLPVDRADECQPGAVACLAGAGETEGLEASLHRVRAERTGGAKAGEEIGGLLVFEGRGQRAAFVDESLEEG